MDCTEAHAMNLWCAVLAKAHRTLSQIPPKDVTLAQLRVLTQFALPGCERLKRIDVARALVMRPDDTNGLLVAMEEQGLVKGDGLNLLYEVTEKGRLLASEASSQIEEYYAFCIGFLSEEETLAVNELLRAALFVPGSFFERRWLSGSIDTSFCPSFCFLAFSIVFQVVSMASKKSTGLSFTDFRFLLELYPKKRFGDKTYRAKDVVRFLRTGRSYVTTASMRLEDQGYISRIPDEDDARGVLFQLQPAGYLCVQDAVEDVRAVLVAFYGDACESRTILGVMKKLLIAEDAILDRMAVH